MTAESQRVKKILKIGSRPTTHRETVMATETRIPGRRIIHLLIAWMVFFGMAAAIGGCTEDQSGAVPPTLGPSLVDRINSAEELQPLLDSADQPLLVVEFYADWCAPCREVAPIMESIAREAPPHVKIVKVNIDENRAIANRFKVRGIPTVVFIREQKRVGSLLGVQPKRKYLEMIETASEG